MWSKVNSWLTEIDNRGGEERKGAAAACDEDTDNAPCNITIQTKKDGND